jgi:hypothetical protein
MGKLTVGANNVKFSDLGVGTYIVPYNNISLDTDIYDNTYPVDPASPKASMYRNRDLFWCSIEADTNRGTADMTYPFSMTGTAPPPGLGVQFKSTSYTYMTFVATPAYGETFFGWYSQQAGGTLISSSATYSPTLASGFYSAWSKMWGRFTTTVGIYTQLSLNTQGYSTSATACANSSVPNQATCWNGVGPIPNVGAIVYVSGLTNGVPTSTATKFNGGNLWRKLYNIAPSTSIKIDTVGVVTSVTAC